MSIPGVDYESLDHSEQEYAVKRLRRRSKALPRFHVYPYLSNRTAPTYRSQSMTTRLWKQPSTSDGSSLKRSATTSIRLNFYCILLEGARSKTGVGTALARLLRDPEGAIGELKSQLHQRQHEDVIAYAYRARSSTTRPTRAGIHSPASRFMQIEVLNQEGQSGFSAVC